jgi:translation initiation factor IF-2
VFVEGWGGDVPLVELSAKTGAGIDGLIEIILLVADLIDLKSDQNGLAKGVVIESHLDSKRGFVATLLIRDGKLEVGQYIVAGGTWAKLKSVEDFLGKRVESAFPSCPVLTTGWTEAPDIGQEFLAVVTKGEAEKKAKGFLRIEKPLFMRTQEVVEGSNKKWLDVIFKADVLSSLEAIDQAIKGVDHEEVGYKVIGYGLGAITDQDVKTGVVNKGVIYGLHVDIKDSVKKLAEKESIKIRTFDIIYHLVEALRKDLSELLEPEIEKIDFGRVQILKTFKLEANYQVIGGRVTKGMLKRGTLVDVVRNGAKIGGGRIIQLQQSKQESSEVKEGLECGMKFEEIWSANPKLPVVIKESDILEAYEEKRTSRSI